LRDLDVRVEARVRMRSMRESSPAGVGLRGTESG
jgi:hypothetical protein